MKKILTFIFILFLSFTFVEAKSIDFSITDAKITEKGGSVEVNDPVFTSTEIDSSITFKEINDYVVYNIVLKNNNEESYKLVNVEDDNKNSNISVSYTYGKEEIKPNETVSLDIKVKYNKILKNVEKKELSDFSVTLVLEDEKGGTGEIIFNPKTSDYIWVYFILLAISIIGIVLIVKKIKGGKVLAVVPFLVLPFVIFGQIQFKINITFKDIEVVGTFDIYNIEINSDNGEEVENRTIKYGDTVGSLPTPSKAGYTFSGWYDDDGNKVNENTVITEETSLTAKYSAIEYNITYNLDGGSANNPTKYTIEDEITLNNPTKTGYTFAGWTEGSNETLRTSVTINKGSTGDKSFTAHYSASTNVAYTVIHKQMDLNGNYVEYETEHLEGATGTAVTPQVKVYEGFNSPSEQTVTIEADGSTEVTYLYERQTRTLTINNSSYVESNIASGSYYYGTSVTLTAKPKTGYTFSKWSNNATNNPLTFELKTNTTIEPVYTANTNTKYKVLHKTEDLTGGTYSVYSEVNGTGTTDSQVTPEVLTIDGFDSPAAQTVTIAADESTVVTYLYERQTRTLTINNSSYVETTTPSGTYPYDTIITLTAKPKQGYLFNKWSNNDVSQTTTFNLRTNTTIEPIYVANPNTKYKVIHKTEDLTGGTYSVYSEVNGTGTTDSEITPEVLTIDGFDSPAAQTVTIAADESTVVTYLYERQTRTLTIYDSAHVQTTTPSGTYPYGTSITLTAVERNGYSFTGWSNNSTSNPLTFELKTNTIISPVYETNGDTPYKVLHKTMDLDGVNYSLYEEINGTGATDAEITPPVKTIEGFDSPVAQTVNIAGDGSTVVTYLYTRQTRTLTINNSSYVESNVASGSHYYGTSVTLTAKPKTGYTFSKWSNDETANPLTFELKTNLTIEPVYTANTNTPYKVLHKTEDLTGGTYSVYSEVNGTGTTDSEITPTVLTITGFDSPNTQTVTIAGDGSTVVTYLYERQNRTLTINNSTYVESNIPSGNYPYGTSVTLTAKPKTGYTFSKWSNNSTSNPLTFNLETDTTIEPVYTANTNTPYKVLHKTKDLTGGGYTVYSEVNETGTTDSEVTPAVLTITGFDSPATQTVTIAGDGSTVVTYLYERQTRTLTINSSTYVETTTPSGSYPYGTSITLTAKERAGYTFSEWSNDETANPLTFELKTNLTIEPIYMANTNTPYKVLHKTEDLTGGNYSLYSEVNGTGTTDSEITPAVLTITGFDSPATQTTTIAGDGSTVVTYLYERQNRTLTINNSTYVESNISSGNYPYGTSVTLTAKPKTGYTFSKWSNNSTSNPLTFNLETDTTIEPVYTANTNTPYKVLHKTEDLTGGGYTVYSEVNGTGVTGEEITPEVLTITGFDSPNTQTVIVAADGSTVVTYLYERQTRTLTINNSSYVETTTPSGSYPYDTVITLTAKPKTGYLFNKWSSNDVSQTTTFNLRTNTTIEPLYIPNPNTPYKVLHKTEDLTGGGYTVYSEVNGTGTTDSEITPEVLTIDGFDSPATQTTTIAGDGSTVVTYLYERQTRTLTINDSTYVETSTPSGTYPYDTVITLTAKERAGYTFNKWSNNDVSQTTTFNLRTNTTIGPIYDLDEYTVTFNSEGGSAVSSITRNYNQAIGTLPTTQKEGFHFIGWYSQDGNTKITAETLVTGNVTYYAHWVKTICKAAKSGTLHTETCSYTGSADGCRGAGYALNETITYGTIPGESSPIPGDAYDCDVNNDGTFDAATERFYFIRQSENSGDDTAVLIHYTSFDENGQMDNSKDRLIYSYDDAMNYLPDSTVWSNDGLISFDNKVSRFVTKDDLVAACGAWNTSNGYLDSCQFFLENTRFQSDSYGRSGVWIQKIGDALYRYHSKNRIVANMDNTSNNAARPVIEIPYVALETDIEIPEYTVTFDSHGGSSVDSITRMANQAVGTLPTPEKDDNTFDGWYTNTNYDVQVTAETLVTANVTYHAKWIPDDLQKVFYIPGSCTFNGNKTASLTENITTSSDLGCVSTINPSGHNIDYTNVKYIDSHISLFSEDNYDADFELGFTIDNYVADNTVDGQATLVNSKVDSEPEFYPGFTVRRKNSNLDSNLEFTERFGSETQYGPTFTYSAGTQIRIARREGKMYFSQDGADWVLVQDINSYSKRFNITTWFGAYSTETSLEATGENSTAGRYFKGTLSNIYIKLESRAYNTVTFNPHGGTASFTEKQVVSGKKVGELPTSEKTGYTFVGWFTEATDGRQIDANEVITSDITFHAQYNENHTVTFNGNGGTLSFNTKEVEHGGVLGELPAAHYTGHILKGWYTDDTFTTSVDETTVINGDTTFIAKWEESNSVAKIGTEEYESLEDAVNDVPTTGAKTTIKILQDIVLTSGITIPSTKWVELDIGSYTISTSTQGVNIFTNNGKIDIINGTITSTAKISSKNGYIIKNNGSGVVNISGGTITYNNSSETEGKVIENSGTVNITGGKLSCNSKAAVINVNAGTLNISGGEIKASNTYKGQVAWNNGGTINISGNPYLENVSTSDATNGRAAIHNKIGTVSITGGTIVSKANSAVKNEGTMTIGDNSTALDITTPVLIGSIYGVENVSGKVLSVYDGIFKGKTAGINSASGVSHNSDVDFNTSDEEVIEGVTYHLAYLEVVSATPTNINISLNANGGSVSPDHITVESGDPVGTLPIPTKGIYTFDGWYQDSGFNDAVIENVTIPTEDTTYYAKWSYTANPNVVSFNMTNSPMSIYYSNIDSWKSDSSTFQTNMDTNFNNYNCSACTAPNYQSCPAPASGKTLCDQPFGYDTGMNASVNVYTSSETNKEKGTLVSYTTSNTGVIYNMIPGETYYWELASDPDVHGLVKANSNANRRNIYSSVRNVRDLGGMSATYTDDEGTTTGTLKYGILFRGPKINDSNDVASLTKIGIDEELDLRGNNSDPHVGTYKYKAILNYNFDTSEAESDIVRDTVTLVMQDVVGGNHIYFHCAIGTDRTGTLAWILEGLLGVPHEEKIQDYELSYFYGLLNRHRFHDYLDGSSINPRFTSMANRFDTNEKVYNWYINDPDNQASEIALLKQFRKAMIKAN